ncbi:probable 28S ribosomal protein S6, mitochondrial [Fopius arisanus]|uniref:Small ribosomal subunit protein bS6m n=1 Tax=Fopius arisanus TaxID=64838 RepID=A0A9R1T0H8_9HYME|nr:PREDICTED: probable 28S ribosomal protein S6, mitochondrial [Fopius arisanus]
MPTYELPLILRVMPKPQITATLKRVANGIFDRGGVIRKIENLGEIVTPYKMSAHNKVHRKASYFIFHFDAPPRKLEDLLEEYGRDVDVVRSRVYKKDEDNPEPCTWHEEMLPPSDRPEVQKLMRIAANQKRGFTKIWNPNSGLDYYPFQR